MVTEAVNVVILAVNIVRILSRVGIILHQNIISFVLLSCLSCMVYQVSKKMDNDSSKVKPSCEESIIDYEGNKTSLLLQGLSVHTHIVYIYVPASLH